MLHCKPLRADGQPNRQLPLHHQHFQRWWVSAEHVRCTATCTPRCSRALPAAMQRHTERYLPAGTRSTQVRESARAMPQLLQLPQEPEKSSQTSPPLPTQWPACSVPQSMLPQVTANTCCHFQTPRRPRWLKNRNYTVHSWNTHWLLHGT